MRVRWHAQSAICSIDHLMIDKIGGQVEYAVMSTGGFLGIAENYSSNYLNLNDTKILGLDFAGLQPAIPVILLFVVLIALPSERLRTRGVQRVRESARVPTIRSSRVPSMAGLPIWISAMRTARIGLARSGQPGNAIDAVRTTGSRRASARA